MERGNHHVVMAKQLYLIEPRHADSKHRAYQQKRTPRDSASRTQTPPYVERSRFEVKDDTRPRSTIRIHTHTANISGNSEGTASTAGHASLREESSPKSQRRVLSGFNEEAIVHRGINSVNRIEKEILLAVCML